ncbi:hypothetical protein RAK27_09875 [Carnobacterium maltaromaticum]|uniref:Uncharacterized protein n=1 Tax=Carnobacterium maltaromaticum TaxID=2751 RepID=A0AAW9JTS6_CARML|nr:hypothetical protein [Carnobacterium maltaromaticum]MDZ5758963.1 hypothetical protein [Carnobacterium maltaromaticum]
MRNNQVTIKIERFGEDIPDEFKEMNMQVMSVYADGNNLHETLCGAFQLALNEVAKYNHDDFTRRESFDSLELTQRKINSLGLDRQRKNKNCGSDN